MSIRRRLSLVLAVAILGGIGGGATPAAIAAPLAPASHCSAGWVSANLSWGHKCLRAGQFCKRGDREYAKFGFSCPSGRLVRR